MARQAIQCILAFVMGGNHQIPSKPVCALVGEVFLSLNSLDVHSREGHSEASREREREIPYTCSTTCSFSKTSGVQWSVFLLCL